MNAREAGYHLGYAAAPLILLAIAAYAGWRIGRKRQPPKFVAWPVGVAAILLAVGALGLQMKKQTDAPPSGEAR